MELSKRILALSPSPTLSIQSKAIELKEAGHDIIGLGVGEPDFNTPQYIIDAAQEAMETGKTKYTAAGGIAPLRDVIIDKFKKDNDLTYEDRKSTRLNSSHVAR